MQQLDHFNGRLVETVDKSKANVEWSIWFAGSGAIHCLDSNYEMPTPADLEGTTLLRVEQTDEYARAYFGTEENPGKVMVNFLPGQFEMEDGTGA